MVDFKNTLSVYQKMINDGLKNIYLNGPNYIKEPINYIVQTKGKRLRPILLLLTVSSFNQKRRINEYLPTALAVELLHNFTLVHDDVMDNDLERRGNLTIHNKWDVSVAILVGDAILALSLDSLQKNAVDNQHLSPIFFNGMLAVCEGQALDKEFETNKEVSIDDYLCMIDKKTGHLLGMSAQLGACLVKADLDVQKKFMNFGLLLGRAFQIQDDLLELTSTNNTLGKSTDSDILLEKKTYIYLLAKSKLKNDFLDVIKECKENIKEGKKKLLILLESNGIIQEINDLIDGFIMDSKSILDSMNLNNDSLYHLIDYIKNRKK